jgi:hypothetical protein
VPPEAPATFVAARMVTHYGGGVEKRLFSASLFASIAQIIVITFGGLIILNSLCIAITPPITALGVGGLAIARANSVASNSSCARRDSNPHLRV